jgi:hypothetical protein
MYSPKRCVLKNKQDGVLDKDRAMDNNQKHNICTNVPSSQTFRCEVYLLSIQSNKQQWLLFAPSALTLKDYGLPTEGSYMPYDS